MAPRSSASACLRFDQSSDVESSRLETHTRKHYVSLRRKFFQQRKIRFIRPYYCLYAELFELFGFIVAPHDSGNIEGVMARVRKQSRKDGATDVSW